MAACCGRPPTLAACPWRSSPTTSTASSSPRSTTCPTRSRRWSSNVVVQVEADAPADDPDLLGIYDGVALTERAANHSGMLPDRILVFRGPLVEMCDSLDELRDEVRITVVHEVAHHFGIGEERLHALGLG